MIVLAVSIHGKEGSEPKLVDVAREELPDVSKALLLRTIKEIAVKEKCKHGSEGTRWFVKDELIYSMKLQVYF